MLPASPTGVLQASITLLSTADLIFCFVKETTAIIWVSHHLHMQPSLPSVLPTASSLPLDKIGYPAHLSSGTSTISSFLQNTFSTSLLPLQVLKKSRVHFRKMDLVCVWYYDLLFTFCSKYEVLEGWVPIGAWPLLPGPTSRPVQWALTSSTRGLPWWLHQLLKVLLHTMTSVVKSQCVTGSVVEIHCHLGWGRALAWLLCWFETSSFINYPVVHL